MKRAYLLSLFLLLTTIGFSKNKDSKIKIAPKLYLIKISDRAYVHVSYMNDNIPCNGLILVDNGKAFLMDTPKEVSDTKLLLDFIKNKLKLQIVGFVTNDWHSDSMGGVGVLNDAGIPSYASEATIEIAKAKNIPYPTNGFKDSLTLQLNALDIFCYYPGAAHTKENIVVWIPSEKILFGSCMVKEVKAKDLGYTDDGDVKAYAETLRKVMQKFPDAQIVIPGHGDFGGMELLQHSLQMAEKL
jgi:metallo-beta-lactamase class B